MTLGEQTVLQELFAHIFADFAQLRVEVAAAQMPETSAYSRRLAASWCRLVKRLRTSACALILIAVNGHLTDRLHYDPEKAQAL